MMSSDFAAARLHLDRAYHYLRGSDATSRMTREALDLLIEEVATAEFARPRGVVVELPERARSEARVPRAAAKP
jgi:hypothetical protein